MPHTVRVGDKFRLLDKEFKVTLVKDSWFLSEVNAAKIYQLYWHLGEADKLDWIKPVPKCSKEFAEAMHLFIFTNRFSHDLDRDGYAIGQVKIQDWINDHTE